MKVKKMLFGFCIVFILLISGCSQKSIDDGVVAHYNFDGDLKDSANDNDLKIGSFPNRSEVVDLYNCGHCQDSNNK